MVLAVLPEAHPAVVGERGRRLLGRDEGRAMSDQHVLRDLLESEKPADLAGEELEQYDLLLEEQAFPFEEKAIELHALNAGRSADGVYDEWVRRSFTRLAELSPARYARTERSEAYVANLD